MTDGNLRQLQSEGLLREAVGKLDNQKGATWLHFGAWSNRVRAFLDSPTGSLTLAETIFSINFPGLRFDDLPLVHQREYQRIAAWIEADRVQQRRGVVG